MKDNPLVREIEKICQEHNIELYYYTAPILQYEDKYSNFFSNRFSNYYDFSKAVSNKVLFMDRKHLNEEGATTFTKAFADIYFD